MIKQLTLFMAALVVVTACSKQTSATKPAVATKQQAETSLAGTYIGTFESKEGDEARPEDVEITLDEGGRVTWKLLGDSHSVFHMSWEQKENHITIKDPENFDIIFKRDGTDLVVIKAEDAGQAPDDFVGKRFVRKNAINEMAPPKGLAGWYSSDTENSFFHLIIQPDGKSQFVISERSNYDFSYPLGVWGNATTALDAKGKRIVVEYSLGREEAEKARIIFQHDPNGDLRYFFGNHPSKDPKDKFSREKTILRKHRNSKTYSGQHGFMLCLNPDGRGLELMPSHYAVFVRWSGDLESGFLFVGHSRAYVGLKITPEGHLKEAPFLTWGNMDTHLSHDGKILLKEVAWSTKSIPLRKLPATHHPSKAEAQAVVRAFEETVRRSINKNEGVLTDANFASVKKLNLENHVIKDLTPLTKLSNLTDLKLSLFHVRDLTPLSKLKKLKKLSLYGCPSIDFKTVANLKQIKSLRLSKNQIRDLTPLAGLSNLEQFEMNEYQITDLGPLKKLRNLKEINLQSLRFRFRKKIADTKISKEQVESLKKALPNCRVLSDYDK